MPLDGALYLPTIYDAALSDEHWPRALSLISEQLPAIGAFLIAVDQVGLPFTIQEAASTYQPEDLRYYFENFGHYDDANVQASAKAPPMRLLRDCDVSGDVTALDDRPDYRWLREKIGVRRKAGVRLSDGKGWMDLLAFQFGTEWNGPPDSLQARLDVILPHVAKVVEINRTFSILRHQYRATLTALDQLRIGTCVMGGKGNIIVCNNEARRIFSLDDGLTLSRMGSLTCPSSDLTADLREKVRLAAITARGEAATPEAVVFAQRKSDSRPFIIEIAPLRDSTGELERSLTGALVFIIDPDNQDSVSLRRLAQLTGLTEAEAEICSQMVNGKSAAEIADARGVAEGTVKSQFKAIYAKTGVGRRADLVRLALTIDPPIGPKDPT
jgi:DNA-binding CsgD family transcriptional regulator/PAS domain-containing protein